MSTTQTLGRTLWYESWGATNIDTGTAYTGPRYAGVYQDATSGLYRMDARYYQTGRGRFTQIDPLPKSVLTANRYAYAGCNPANATDVTGLDWTTDCLTQGTIWGLAGAGTGFFGTIAVSWFTGPVSLLAACAAGGYGPASSVDA